jgi:hypothetical protein
MHDTYTEAISMFAGLRKLTATALALAALAVALTATASAAPTMPKKGFLPGTWIGQGTIKGSVTEGEMYTMFNGRVSFVLKVSPKLGVSGAGTWKMDMLGTQDGPPEYAVDATIVGAAALALKGTSTKVTFSGKQKLMTQIRVGGKKTPPKESESDLFGQLVITKAERCKVAGQTQLQPGVTLTWSAKFKGACSA